MTSKFATWIAQGFGIGKAPFAPGTFGSFFGLLWLALIALPGNSAIFLTAILLGIVVSVLTSDIAEGVLNKKDPGSVVIDEIIAIPICFLGWIYVSGHVSPSWFFANGNWKISLALVIAFRVFDIWKPWPICQTQRLPGGWGVTMDDVLAAIYVAVISGFLLR